MAASKTGAHLAIFVAVILAVLWFVCIFAPWNWQTSVGLFVNFYANMMKMEISKGTAPKIISGVSNLFAGKNKIADGLSELLDKPMWMGEGTMELCQPHYNLALNWCNTWQMVKFGSWGMLSAGVTAACFLLLGAFSLWYYANVHATHTGRMGAKLSFILAPVIACIGLIQYILLTLDFGMMPVAFVPQMPQRMFDIGFMVCCTLCLLSWLPLAMHAIFMKTDPDEKHGGKDDMDMYVNNPAASYSTFPASGMADPMVQQGWTPAGAPQQMYGGAPPQMYGDTGGNAPPMPQRVDVAHGGPMPGMGQTPAW